MPVMDFLIEGKRDVADVLELEAKAIGLGYDVHDATSLIYGVGPKDSEKDELYAVRIKGSPREAINEVFVSTARHLLSYDQDEPYPQTSDLDYAPIASPPRPAVVNALTAAVTKNNGSGKNLPHIVPR
jgi:hypothetical protein